MTWMERIAAKAAKKAKLKGWHAWIFTAAEQGGLFVTGAVCPPKLRGPNKGRPNVRKHDRSTRFAVYLSKRECA